MSKKLGNVRLPQPLTLNYYRVACGGYHSNNDFVVALSVDVSIFPLLPM